MIKIVKSDGDGYGMFYREFIISAAADVANLPTSVTGNGDAAAPGSVAYTQDLSKTYMLGPDDVWREV